MTGMVSYDQARRRSAGRGGARRAPVAVLARPAGQDRRDHRHDVGDPDVDPRPAAHLHGDVARRAAAAAAAEGAPEVPHAARRHVDHRRGRRRSSPACSRSTCSASWSRSASCWRSRPSARACWCCAARCREAPRPFRVPFAPVTCTAGVLMCLGLTFFLPHDTWMRLAVWTGGRLRGLLRLRVLEQQAARASVGERVRWRGARRALRRFGRRAPGTP